ncbi:MAG: hypothetical protein WKF78_12500 [Candidatus Limnocylindrales bacterium]
MSTIRRQQAIPDRRFLMHERLRPLQVARRASLHEIRRQRERRAGKPDHRHGRCAPDEPDRFEQRTDRGLRVERPESVEVRRLADRVGDDGPDPVDEVDGDPDARQRRRDVGEDDRRIDSEAGHGLET